MVLPSLDYFRRWYNPEYFLAGVNFDGLAAFFPALRPELRAICRLLDFTALARSDSGSDPAQGMPP
jgi:hypothetical protein